MLVLNPEVLRQLLDRCNSEDEFERFEAWEILWSHTYNQGDASDDAPQIISILLDWIKDRHQDWVAILRGMAGCSEDFTFGPTRTKEMHARSALMLNAIIGGRHIFEDVLNSQCYIVDDMCLSHHAAGALVSMTDPNRSEWLARVLISVIRKNPDAHEAVWADFGLFSAYDSLSNDDLHFCLKYQHLIGNGALFHLVSRGNNAGIEQLRRALQSFDPLLLPTVQDAATIVRKPENVPFDILMSLYMRATDLRITQDLACGSCGKLETTSGRAGTS